jgi:molybdopterin molybdotransferase
MEIEEARRLVLAEVAPLAEEEVPLGGALGRVLAEDVVSEVDVPGFDNSAMDGYAVRATDTAGASEERPAQLRVVGESRAGVPFDAAVGPGEAIAISTGAALPGGADAIVRVEDTRPREQGDVDILSEVVEGRDVRRSDDDIATGATVLGAGTQIGPAALGVLASIGRTTARCARRPRAALLCTGDELRPPGEPLPAGGLYNSNAHSLTAIL